MDRQWIRTCASLLTSIGGLLLAAESVHAQQIVSRTDSAEPSSRTSNFTPAAPAPPAAKPHPLTWVLKYARDEQVYLQQHVQDFTCHLTKRERIEGELQDYQYIAMRVREEVRVGDRVVQPLSVFLEYFGPEEVAGRKVLYVEGKFDNKMRIRKGGKRFSYVVIDLDPYGESARHESQVPITETGFSHMLTKTIRALEHDIAADPSGENTKVEHLKGAAINGRNCEVIRITHPKQENGMQFHSANVYVDTELHVPVRLDSYGWPEQADQAPPLIEEYTYTNLKLNLHLGDSAFDPELLRKK